MNTMREKKLEQKRKWAKQALIQDVAERGEELNIDQACQFTGLRKNTIYVHCCKRTIPYRRRGRESVFYTNELRRYRELSTVVRG